MGLGVALRNLFQSIFGKKRASDGTKITKEVRKRAKELGVTPEEYLKITQENGSIWGVRGSTQSSSASGTGVQITDNTIEALRGNVRAKASELGISDALQKPIFGALTLKLSAIVAPMSENVSLKPSEPVLFIDVEYTRSGTYSLV